jgi:dTDP-4-amino-4,6-dideoxygalactose transaminase
MSRKPIYVTQPTLAPLVEYKDLLQNVWESGILTHNGPMVQRLEKELQQKLEVNNLTVVLNGTIALQMAIKALELKGEIITTPFTWVATVSAIKWEGCTPVFCDIDQDSLNLDPQKIEALITEHTVAIMPVHVFGTACEIEEIQAIATKYDLKVIYDAAHAIGTSYKGKSVLEYGDISATSMHATKLFNTGEGGACITKSNSINEKLQRIRFFGHNNVKEVVEDGFNGKMTEVHASLGLANLKYFDAVLEDRKEKYLLYKELLQENNSLRFQRIKDEETNFSYFPVIFESEEVLLNVQKGLNDENIFPRRYFYPSVNTYKEIVMYQPTPISEDISKRVLCLPLFYDLSLNQIKKICEILTEALNKENA